MALQSLRKPSKMGASGNVITTTTKPKADATSKKAEIDGRLDIAESRGTTRYRRG